MIEIFSSLQLVGTIFAALLGLAFGSFLNVFLTRFPEGESIVSPRSHCRNCDHKLAWWENLPLLSWVLLRGRCRACRSWIGFRYPVIELTVGLLWTACWIKFSAPIVSASTAPDQMPHLLATSVVDTLGYALLCLLLVALAALDQEYFWLPDLLTLPGIGAGLLFTVLRSWASQVPDPATGQTANLLPASVHAFSTAALSILASAGLILFIRLAYWLVRRQEGMGLGDAKLMAMLGAWLGLGAAIESFVVSVFAASAAALVCLVVLAVRRKTSGWATVPLPFGTFLCVAACSEIFYPNWIWNALSLENLFR